jgi:ubiquinone/menaquinone biosynthesis C-methylase UbiE
MAEQQYVHGYGEEDSERLVKQSVALEEILHADEDFPAGTRILEAGCGVGAQTVILAHRFPEAEILSLDISETYLAQAEERVRACGFSNVTFRHADLAATDLPPESADHIFVCFVLEHIPEPEAALRNLYRALRPGGSVTVIEGDHGSAIFHPESPAAWHVVDCLIELQHRAGGDGNIGRRLYPLLTGAGFAEVTVAPAPVYVDAGHPALVEEFTEKIFIAMVEASREAAIRAGITDPARWEEGIAALRRTKEPDGTLYYSFFKATAVK